MDSARITFRANELLSRRLDRLAKAHGGSRSAAVRAAIVEATTTADDPAVPSYDELLRLLGVAARGGSVSAIRLLLEEYRRRETEPAPSTSAVLRLATKKEKAR